MNKMNRVAITGLGTICGMGHTTSEIWKSALLGESGISVYEGEHLPSELAIKFGGFVKGFELSEDIMPSKEAARYDRFIHFALHSIHEALCDAGLLDSKEYVPSKMGCILGIGIGGLPFIEEQCKNLFDRGPRRVSPFFIPSIITNMASGLASIRFQLGGPNYSIASACASSTHALASAAMEIMLGRQDMIVSGGCESTMSALAFAGFSNMKALSKRVDEPLKASRPFDADRDGFVMGEGAGIVILENLDKAKARGAKIYAELVGFGSSSDCYHITAPHPDGLGAVNCMKQALETANVSPSQLDHVNAHGTSTPLGDVAEIKAIKKLCGDHAYNVHVTSTKSMSGHLLGAAGGLETIFCALTLFHGKMLPTINLDNLDPEIDIPIVANKPQDFKGEYVLNNSFGFGGTNASVLLKKY